MVSTMLIEEVPMKLNDATIKAEIKSHIENHSLAGANLSDLHDDDSFFENGIIDSAGVLELVAFVEEQFNITVTDEEVTLENLDSVNRLIGFIRLKIGDL
ncbi:MAG: acyl carrier protein, partial [bacterium]